MNKNKKIALKTSLKRILPLILAAMIVLSLVAGAFSVSVNAIEPIISGINVTFYPNDDTDGQSITGSLINGEKYKVVVSFTLTGTDNAILTNVKYTDIPAVIGDSNSILVFDGNIDVSVNRTGSGINQTHFVVTAKSGVSYNKYGYNSPELIFTIDAPDGTITVPIRVSDKYISGDTSSSSSSSLSSSGSVSTPSGSNGGSSEVEVPVASDIAIENVVLKDSTGERIDVVTKDSPPFTMEILYADIGLSDVDVYDLRSSNMQAYITTNGGFKLKNSNVGKIALVSTTGDSPRFRVTFTNVEYDGGASTLGIRVQYRIYDKSVKGEATATVYQTKVKEDDKDAIAPPTPYIIISKYSYGDQQIEAGKEFNLDLYFTNTSADTPLENIVITVTTTEDLSIASASNTVYVASLEAGGNMNLSIDLRAKPAAKVGSHSVTVEFLYQYLSDKKREEVKKSESIAIPITQIDRFAVDPITEAPYIIMGDEGYVTVTFINRGKSTTSNISVLLKSDDPISAASEHFGNLEAGKSNTVDLIITASEAGQFSGDIVVQYEDENTNIKEITTPITVTVEAPYVPPVMPEFPTDIIPPPDSKSKAFATSMSVIGGLAVAIPITLYLIKRVKAKGIEDDDEDY